MHSAAERKDWADGWSKLDNDQRFVCQALEWNEGNDNKVRGNY